MRATTTSLSRPLRIAVIGAGAMGQTHCKTIAEHVPEMRLAAVVDAHAEIARSVGKSLAVPAFTSVDELLAAGIADAALVATPHPLHLSAAEACLTAGMHVLCEKPLAETVSAADRMLAAADRASRTLAVMFQHRFEPVFEAALKFVQDGGLGVVRRTLLVLPDFRTQAYYDATPWRATWKGEGGGVLINQAPHLMDLFILLSGMPCSVTGWATHRLHDIEVEDQAEARLCYSHGATGFMYASTNEPTHLERIEIVGTRGSLSYRHGQIECITYEDDIEKISTESKEVWKRPDVRNVTPVTETIPLDNLQARLMNNFARHILYGDPLRCDAASGRQALELANAIMLSSHLDISVDLPISRTDYDALLERLRKGSHARKKNQETIRETDPRLL